MIVAICNQKGGVGKTTLTVNLAAEWQRRRLNVLVVDADPQGTARTWAGEATEDEREPPAVVGLEARTLVRQVPQMAVHYDRVAIDTPPRLGPATRTALAVADLGLIPIGVGGADAWALAETLEIIEEVRALRPELVVALVLNRIPSRTRFGTEVRDLLLEQTDLTILSSVLGQRIAYAEALTGGWGASTYEPNSVAAAEVIALTDEVERMLKKCRGQSRRPRSRSRQRSHPPA